MPLICTKAPDRIPGCWRRIPKQNGEPGHAAELVCPSCGHPIIIDSRVVQIDAKGTVNRQVNCTNCSWGVPSVRLNGWCPIVSGSETIETVAMDGE